MSEADITLEYNITDNEYNKMLKFLQKYADDIAYEVNLKLAEQCYKYALNITKSAIDAFYSAYDPHLYERTGSLYDIFDIQVSNDDFIFAIDSDLMGWHRSNEAVIALDFMKGFHGGSRWRTPPRPGWANTVDGPMFAQHSWQYWHPAKVPQTFPPYATIKLKWNSFLRGKYNQLKKQIIIEVASKYIKLL